MTAAIAADPPRPSPLVSVIVVAYNAEQYLRACLATLRWQRYPSFEVIVIDTGTRPEATAAIVARFPEVRLIRAESNLGYAGGNNLGLAHVRGDYLAVLNPDTEVEPGWLAALVAALEEEDRAGLATSKILLSDRRDRINTCGNDVHYTGLAMCRGLDLPASAYADREPVAAVSGAAFLIGRELFTRLGGFDEHFFMYLEDTDLSWRASLLGFNSLFVPESVVYHHYVTRVSAAKLFYLERNRHLMLLQNLQFTTLVLLAPALLLMEGLTWGFATLRGAGYLKAKLRAYRWIGTHLGTILATRWRVQATRCVDDRALLRHLGHRLAWGQLTSGMLMMIVSIIAEAAFLAWRRAVLATIAR